MRGITTVLVGGLMVGAGVMPAGAQGAAAARPAADPQRDQARTQVRAADRLRQARYQISQMERMLEGAVEHGATVVRERVQAAMRAQTFVNENAENAHVRGFRIEGYGVFFDVEVPPLQGTLMWSLRTLDQNDLGLASALNTIKAHVDAAGDTNLQQALKRIELQVAPVTVGGSTPVQVGARAATGAPASTTADDTAPDPILNDPQEAYRAEVQQQITDAMLDYSVPLGIGAEEWLAVGARGHNDRPLLAPADSDARTIVIRLRGADLAAFRAGQLSREDAVKRVEVRVF